MDDDNPVVAALPGNGWRAVYRLADGTEASSPIVAWLVHQDGDVQPVDVDSDGITDNPKGASNFVRLLHPDEETS